VDDTLLNLDGLAARLEALAEELDAEGRLAERANAHWQLREELRLAAGLLRFFAKNFRAR
jgi:hypothetical protein